MPNIFEIHARQIEAAMPDIIAELTIEARNFFDESWDNQGFTDKSLSKWKKSKDKKGNEKQVTLVETGILRRSLRTETTETEGKVFTEVPYAKVHNEGETIKGTLKISPFERKRKGKTENVKAHTRNVNTTFPKRKFMGESAMLNKRAEEIILKRLDQVLSSSGGKGSSS